MPKLKKKSQEERSSQARRCMRLAREKNEKQMVKQDQDTKADREYSQDNEPTRIETVSTRPEPSLTCSKQSKIQARRRASAEAHQKARSNLERKRMEQAINTVARKVSRENPIRRETDNMISTESHRKARADIKRKMMEQAINTLARKRLRQNPIRLKADQISSAESHRKARAEKEKREVEQERNTAARNVSREDPIRREMDQIASAESHRKARAEKEKREVEQERNTAARNVSREDPIRREMDQIASAESHRKARAEKEKKEAEQERNTAARNVSREDPIRREMDQVLSAYAHRIARADKEKREAEQERNTAARNVSREDPIRREMDQIASAESHRKARADKEKREAEQERNTAARNVSREDPIRREIDQVLSAYAHRIARADKEKRELEKARNTAARKVSREDPIRREMDQLASAESHRKARADKERREVEQERNTAARNVSREDPIRREMDQLASAESHRKARADKKKREAEQERNTEARNVSREDPIRREIDQVLSAYAHRIARADKEKRELEKTRNTAARKVSREDPIRREMDQLSSAESHRKARADKEKREVEQARNTAARNVSREDPIRREMDQLSSAESHRKARADKEKREVEQAINTAARRVSRENPKRHEADQIFSAESHRKAREDGQRKEEEQERNSEARKRKRMSEDYRSLEKAQNSAKKRKLRGNSSFREEEKSNERRRRELFKDNFTTLLAEYNKIIRLSPTTICSCCGCLWYETSTFSVPQEELRRRGASEEVIEQIYCTNLENPRFCSTCKRCILTKEKTIKVPRLALSNGFDFPSIPEELQDLSPLEERLVALRIPFMQIRLRGAEGQVAIRGNVVNVENDLLLCTQSIPRPFDKAGIVHIKFQRKMSYQKPYMEERIRTNKVYRAAKYLIKTELYQKEDIRLCTEWENHELGRSVEFTSNEDADEETFIESTHACQNTEGHESTSTGEPVSRQVGGNNAATPVRDASLVEQNSSSTAVPREFPLIETETILRSDEGLEFGMTSNNSLSCKNERFESGVGSNELPSRSVSRGWMSKAMGISSEQPGEKSPFIQTPINDNDLAASSNLIDREDVQGPSIDESDGQESCLSNNGSDHDNEEQWEDIHVEETECAESLIYLDKEVEYQAIKIAPGEANIPIPFYRDKEAEEMSFPSIYCGKIRRFKSKVSYTDIAKSEIRRYDRRACSGSHLLYAFKKSLNEKVYNAIQICLRQRKNSSNIKAKHMKSPAYLKTLIEKDDGYAVFQNIRSSPCYWKKQQKKVNAMIRQLGRPAFFITLSAAETRWTELLQILTKIVKQQEISEEEASQISFLEKAELIRKDPVTCMRHFDHRFRQLLNKLLKKKKGGIFDPYELLDFFARIEFQMRGSAHVHSIHWLKNAPVFKKGNSRGQKKYSINLSTDITHI